MRAKPIPFEFRNRGHMVAYGVYISNDIEMVITERYAMAFRRVKSQDALESCLLEKPENTSQYLCVGVCRSLPATTIAYPIAHKWEYAFQGTRRIHFNNASFAAWIGKPTLPFSSKRIRCLWSSQMAIPIPQGKQRHFVWVISIPCPHPSVKIRLERVYNVGRWDVIKKLLDLATKVSVSASRLTLKSICIFFKCCPMISIAGRPDTAHAIPVSYSVRILGNEAVICQRHIWWMIT